MMLPEVVGQVPSGEVGRGRGAQLVTATISSVNPRLRCDYLKNKKNISEYFIVLLPVSHFVELNVLGDVLPKLVGIPGIARGRHHQPTGTSEG